MKCEEIRELLTEYLDGELPPEAAAAVEEHTTACGACRAELDALRQTSALLKSLPKADAPLGLAENVTASLDREITVHRRAALMRWMQVGGWMSAAAAIIIVIQLVPWAPPSESIAPSSRTAVRSAPAADETMEKGSTPADAMPGTKPRPPMVALAKDVKRAEIAGKPGAERAAGEETRRTRAMPDTAKAEDEVARDTDLGRRAPSVRSVAPGTRATIPAGKGAVTDNVRATARAGKAALAKTAEGAGRAKSKVGLPRAETKGGLAAAAKTGRTRKQPEPLTLTYACSDLKAGRLAVLKALAAARAVQGDQFEQDAKAALLADETTNVIAAHVPSDRLPALVAALKLAGWPPPKVADKEADGDATAQAPATVRFGAKAAPQPNVAPSKKVGDASAADSPREAGVRAGEQAKVQQDVLGQARAAKQTYADTAQQATPTITIRIILEVKPAK